MFPVRQRSSVVKLAASSYMTGNGSILKTSKIPEAAVMRLAVYCGFEQLKEQGYETVSSCMIARGTGVTPACVRRTLLILVNLVQRSGL